MPPYIIFSDKTLHALAAAKPTTRDAFAQVWGIGQNKAEKFAERFIAEIINSDKNESETAAEIPEDQTKPAKTYSVEEIRKEHAKAYAPWTEDDDILLKHHYEKGLSIPELAQKFGRNEGAIRSRLKKLGLQ